MDEAYLRILCKFPTRCWEARESKRRMQGLNEKTITRITEYPWEVNNTLKSSDEHCIDAPFTQPSQTPASPAVERFALELKTHKEIKDQKLKGREARHLINNLRVRRQNLDFLISDISHIGVESGVGKVGNKLTLIIIVL